jgi:membrane protease YdiL (CAAX protease family)
MRRLVIFLAISFSISWIAWGILVPLARTQTIVYGQVPFMLLYMLGGLGPTIGAYAAVVATPADGPLVEFHRRLLRWRVAAGWYLAALALPVALAVISTRIAALIEPDVALALSVQPWYMFVPLFAVMILGGGLEELGWRGVAQPEMERRVGRPAAAVLVGLIWTLWHLPLFLLPGVNQYRMNFAIFAVATVGGALILAWLYGCTASILLCVMFHAAWNAVAALGLAIPSQRASLALFDGLLKVLVGAVLLAFGQALSKRLQPTALGATVKRRG